MGEKTITVPTPSGAYRRVKTSDLDLFRYLATSEDFTVTEEGIALPDGRFLPFERGGASASSEALVEIRADLNRVREKAEQAGVPMVAFIILAIAEAREQLASAPPALLEPEK